MRTLAVALLLAAHAAAAAEGVHFGLPEPQVTSERVVDGRKVSRYEHDSVATWGCEKPQRDYFHVVVPKDPRPKSPLHVVLHSAGHSGDSALAAGLKYPAWIHYYARPGFTVLYLDCKKSCKADWWWGWHAVKRGKGRYAKELCPAEKRVLSTLEWVIRTHGIDRDRVYLSGISMGGSGSLGIGLCRGDVFAAVAVAVPARIERFTHRMALPHPEPPLVVNLSSHIDNWAVDQEKFLAYCKAQRYPVVFAWGLFGHTNNVSAAHPAAFEFPWLEVRRDEVLPVFTNASTDHRYPGFKNRTAPDQAGQINAFFRWKAISDTAEGVAVELRLVGLDDLTRKTKLPDTATVDVTLRRLQQFAPVEGKTYPWRMVRDGKTVQSGTVRADSKGLLTVPRLTVTPSPTQLVVGQE